MNQALNIFLAGLDRVRALHALHLNFVGTVAPIVDLSDILRAEIVLIVSAFDCFIHDVTRVGMIEIWQGVRNPTPAYVRFNISLGVATQLAGAAAVAAHLETEIRTRHSFLAFQQPDNVADAIRLYSPIELWNTVAAQLGQDAQALKAQLRLIVERRNKIAHEADLDPSFPGQRWPITRADVEDAFRFIEEIGNAIYNATH